MDAANGWRTGEDTNMDYEAMGPNARLALDTIRQKHGVGIPSWIIHPMEHRMIDRLAGMPEGSYAQDPARVYLAMQRNAGTCMIDQYIPDNPLTIGDHGYRSSTPRTATTGAEQIVLNGMTIDSPERVVEHLERFGFPAIEKTMRDFNADAHAAAIIKRERETQEILGPDILKGGYAYISFPYLYYSTYGYVNYFMAYALYPEVIEKHFRLQADLAVLKNKAAARAYREGDLAPIYRLDHDMADSRGTLVDIKSLDRLWFPHFARSIAPLLETDMRLIWHCDGNLMAMVPRLIEAGVSGFQGFQYEAGMDYERICRMKDRWGRDLIIIGGVSVTRTLPHGTPTDVRREIKWLVEKGPRVGLFLGISSSITPGVPFENLQAMVEGFKYYRAHGRD